MSESTLNQPTTPQFKLVDILECPACKTVCPDDATACKSCGVSLQPESPESAAGTDEALSPSFSLPPEAHLQNGAFLIEEVLGQGGFGITYRSTEVALQRSVAIKEFFPAGSSRQGKTVLPPPSIAPEKFAQMRSKFIREAQTLARFNHPGIVRVFSVFEENNTAYMVMELLDGHSLQTSLDEARPMPEKRALHVIAQVGGALLAVHQEGFLHRDIKPDNIILTDDSRIVLIDFGSARIPTDGSVQTMTTTVSPGYAPLEQYSRQAEIGTYTDVYALAATLYYCLTKKLPASAMDRMSGVELIAPMQLSSISDTVNSAVMRALEIRAEERPQTVAEFLKELRAEHGKSPISTLPAAPPPAGNSCVRCGTTTSNGAQMCSDCRKTRAPQAEENSSLPLSARPDTLFDTIMYSIPSWAWATFWITILSLVIGRIGLGVVRYQNGGRDFSEQLTIRVKDHPKAKQLREVKLEQSEGVLDREAMVKRYDGYVGTVRYQDGDVGVLRLDVTKRDWFYRPERFKFSYSPKDFGGLIAGHIKSEVNGRLASRGTRLRITSISLTRRSRTKYEGQYIIGDDFKSPIGVSATVLTFNEDGEPSLWSYILD